MQYLEKCDVVYEEDENDCKINENVSEIPNDTSNYIERLSKREKPYDSIHAHKPYVRV